MNTVLGQFENILNRFSACASHARLTLGSDSLDVGKREWLLA